MRIKPDRNLDHIVYGKIEYYSNQGIYGGVHNKFSALRRYPVNERQMAAIELYVRHFINDDLRALSAPRIISYSHKELIPRYLNLLNEAIDVVAYKQLKPDNVWFTLRFNVFNMLDKNKVWHNKLPRSTYIGRSDIPTYADDETMFMCEIRDPSSSVRRDVEGGYIAPLVPFASMNEFLLKAGTYLKLVDSYTMMFSMDDATDYRFGYRELSTLVWEHYDPAKTSHHIDDMKLIEVKERIIKETVLSDGDEIMTDYYHRNLYFLASITFGQVTVDGVSTDDRYTRTEERVGDIAVLAGKDKYGRDLGYYLRMKDSYNLSINRKDVYGNTPLMHKLLVNDLFISVNRGISDRYIQHTRHMYDLSIMIIPNNDGLMPITMFDTLDVFKMKGIKTIVSSSDSLGRTSLHRLVFIFNAFMIVHDDNGNIVLNTKYGESVDFLTDLIPYFDFDKRDVYGLKAVDYYKAVRDIHGGVLDALFSWNPLNKWLGSMKFDNIDLSKGVGAVAPDGK
jgi:hypothetical protein